MRTPSVVVVGSMNMDLIYRVPTLPSPGETLQAKGFFQAHGGKGANQAVAAARHGANVVMIGCAGHDANGASLVASLASDAIDTQHIARTAQAATGMASIYVNDDAENSIVVLEGANALLEESHIEAAQQAIVQTHCLLGQLETPIAPFIAAATMAKRAGVTVIFNASPVKPLDSSVLALVDILIVNVLEAKQLTGEEDLDKAARALQQLGPSQVIVSLGAKGVMLISAQSEPQYLPAFVVDAIDTTGAGDTFAGTLAACLAENMELLVALKHAQAAAAICVTRSGAQPSIPKREETDAVINSAQL